MMPDDDYPHPLGLHVTGNREREALRGRGKDAIKNTETQSRRSKQRIVQPRAHNLAATVFVFESTRKPYETHVVYLDQASNYADHSKWKHTGTLDPAAWIEHLLNNPAERNEQINRATQL